MILIVKQGSNHSCGANVNYVSTRYGGMALMLACDNLHANRFEIVELLVNEGANVNARRGDGKAVLMCAVRGTSGDDCIMIVKLLIDKEANTSMRDNNQKTALSYLDKYRSNCMNKTAIRALLSK